jgi:nitroreductase
LAGNGEDPVLVEKGNRKTIEWGEAPGILLVTCKTDKSSGLVRKNPAVIEEDYATCSCICQNLLLLLEAENIASKWSTGAVWEHPDFAKNIGIQDPENERVVGMIFYGYSEQSVPERSLSPLEQHLKTY